MKKSCLIVIDYQTDFVTGSLGNPAALALEDGIAERIAACRENGDDILFTLDTHEADYMTTHEGRNLPVPHCILGTPGHDLYGRVGEARHAEDPMFQKETFGSRGLFQHLRESGYDEVELCGVVTNICVVSNAVLARTALPEAEITVRGSLCASNDPKLHQAALDVMRTLHINIL